MILIINIYLQWYIFLVEYFKNKLFLYSGMGLYQYNEDDFLF